jgi:hypothetical protein
VEPWRLVPLLALLLWLLCPQYTCVCLTELEIIASALLSTVLSRCC